MRYLWLIISTSLAVACSTYVMPDAAQIPWQYPHLSTTGCPDLTGIYDARANGHNLFYNHSLMTENLKNSKTLDIGKVDFFEIKQHADGIDIQFWNAQQKKTIFTKIDGAEFGCADDRLIKKTSTGDHYGGGEIPYFPYIHYAEYITSKLPNGNLSISIKISDLSESISGLNFGKPMSENFIVQRIK